MIKVDLSALLGQLGKIVFSVFIATFFIIFLMSFSAISQPSLSGILASFFIITPMISLNALVIAMPLILFVALPYNYYLLKTNKLNWLYWIIPPTLLTPMYSWFILSRISGSSLLNDKFLGADIPILYFTFLGLLAGFLCRYFSCNKIKKISFNAVGFFIMGMIMLFAITCLIIQTLKQI